MVVVERLDLDVLESVDGGEHSARRGDRVHSHVADDDSRTGDADDGSEHLASDPELGHVAVPGGHERVGAALDLGYAGNPGRHVVAERLAA